MILVLNKCMADYSHVSKMRTVLLVLNKCKCVYSKCREKKRNTVRSTYLLKPFSKYTSRGYFTVCDRYSKVYIKRVFHGLRPLKYTSNDVVFQIYAIDTYCESVKLTVLLKERCGVNVEDYTRTK